MEGKRGQVQVEVCLPVSSHAMLSTRKQRPAAPMVAKAPSTRSSAWSHDSLPIIPKTSDVQDNGADVFAVPDQDYRQCLKRTNARTSGHLNQLERVGRAIEASPLPRTHTVHPSLSDEPVNIMAPTPHCPRKKKPKTNLNSKVGDYISSVLL